MSTLCMTEMQSAPMVPTENKIRMFFLDDGILRSIDSDGVITVYAPEYSRASFLQYSTSAQQSTTNSTILNMPVDINTFTNQLFTKVNATDFRTDFNGLVIAYFSANPYSTTNDRGYAINIRRSGVDLSYTFSRGWSKDRDDRANGVSMSAIIPCSVNTIFQFRMSSNEGVNIVLPSGAIIAGLRVYRVT